MKFAIGQKVKRNPAPFVKEKRPVPERVGTVVNVEQNIYRVRWPGDDDVYGYFGGELIPAK